jgi:ATP synthase protein I
VGEPTEKKSEDGGKTFVRQVGKKESRMLNAQRKGVRSVWLGFGMIGLIGWSVVVPTLLGAWLGRWLDTVHPGKPSWTMALLFAGLFVGCLNAWRWVAKEDKAMREDQDDHDH